MEEKRSAFWKLPSTRIGKWTAGFLLAFSIMYIVNMILFGLTDVVPGSWKEFFLPMFSIVMLLSGLVGGILGLVAILRARERSWVAWFSLLPAAFVLFLLVGEFLFPH